MLQHCNGDVLYSFGLAGYRVGLDWELLLEIIIEFVTDLLLTVLSAHSVYSVISFNDSAIHQETNN